MQLGPVADFHILKLFLDSLRFVDVEQPQLLLVLASTVSLGPESRGTHDHILLH
jgi:hypothetical protein